MIEAKFCSFSFFDSGPDTISLLLPYVSHPFLMPNSGVEKSSVGRNV